MTTIDFITQLFLGVDDKLGSVEIRVSGYESQLTGYLRYDR